MLSIEHARPTASGLLNHIAIFEDLCMGTKNCSPSKFREINEELSIGAVLMLGKRRFQKEEDGKRLYWRGLDEREYDMGLINETNVMRDYPGFHATRSLSLGNHMVQNSEAIPVKHGKGTVTRVTLQDGTAGIGPNYRTALRNASMKMHLKQSFNHFSFANLWHKVWGNA